MENSDKLQIIIPTMGDPKLLVPCVERILVHRCTDDLELIVVMNTNNEKHAAVSHFQIQGLVQAHNDAEGSENIDLQWLDLGEPKGWSGGVNAGIRHILGRFAPYVVIMNDDCLVTPGWADLMRKSFSTDRIHLSTHAFSKQEYLNGDGHSASEYGKIGMVGPVTNVAGGPQQIEPPHVDIHALDLFVFDSSATLDAFAGQFHDRFGPITVSTDFLSGFCTMYSSECLEDLLVGEEGSEWLVDTIFGIGGYDDNDISVRASMSGWRQGIAYSSYVHHIGHQTLDKHFPEMERGLANIGKYLNKWHDYTQRDQTVAAVYRVKLFTLNDLLMLRASMIRMGQLCDGIGLLFTGNPATITKSPDWNRESLPACDVTFIASCADAKSADDVRKATSVWLSAISEECQREIETACDVWDGEWNERDERNRSIELADELGTDWVFSVDHDEIVEDRITRAHIDRLMKHPNPQVRVFDIGWLNHWDSPRLCRVDAPWSAPDYSTSMRGFRMWRRNDHLRYRIQGGTDIGLHCGNCPEFELSSKRVANLRMRHFGYMRHEDRYRKWNFYNKIDPNPDSMLTQGRAAGEGSYSHLVNEEGMQLSPYVPSNGIAFSMLLYKEDQAPGLEYLLSNVYSMSDRIVLVWTGEEPEPSAEIKAIGDAYGVDWVHHPMNDDLAACRNAGIDFIREQKDLGVSWFFTMDDDERFQDDFGSMVAIRRMAEVSDSFGWMFRFRNLRSNGEWNWSETCRLVRLDPFGIVRYSGRVHETFENAFKDLTAKHGIHPQVRYFPFPVDHFGLAKSDDEMQPKLEKYTRMLIAELKDNPTNSSAWMSLGLQYENDSRYEERDRCYEVAMKNAGTGYLPYKTKGDVCLREARGYFQKTIERLSPAHPYYKIAGEVLQMLNKVAPDAVVSGAGETAVPHGFDLADLEALEKEASMPGNGSSLRIENLDFSTPATIDSSQPSSAGV